MIRAALLAACVAACLGAAPLEVVLRANVAYGPLPSEMGDLFLPPATGHPRPAVLVIHGGGWISGSRTTNADLSRMVAAQGFVVFDIDYRLGEAAKPDTWWPAQLVDTQLAVRWLRANAASLQVDPARLGAIGDSAGGTLAVFLGVLDHPVGGDQAGLLANQSTGVSAVAESFGVTDLAAVGPKGGGMVENMFGSRTPAPGRVESVSPLPFVTPRTAPMFLVHGDSDDFIPLDQSQRLVEALKAQGVPVHLVVYHGGHGFEGVAGPAIGALLARQIAFLKERLRP